jgi:arylsulfatase A-like enzyme
MLRIVRLAAVSLALPLLLGGCGGDGDRANLLLLTLDTVRTDALGSYGGSRALTPHLDALAGESLRYTQAITTAPYTGPSHASIHTGLHPARHGLRDFLAQSLPRPVVTLAEILAEQGYQTGGFVSAYVLDPRFGLDQGFDVYSSPRVGGRKRLSQPERPARETVGEALTWLAAREPERPFFVWIHLFDAHAPYLPPPRFRAPPPGVAKDSIEWQRHLYYRETTAADLEVGRLVGFLRDRGLYDDLIVAVVADHGELLGEHGRPIRTHSPWLVDAAVRVPMLLRLPGVLAPGTVDAQVRVIDLFPTLLEALGLEIPPGTEGESLRRVVGGSPRAAYSETLYEHHPRRAEQGRELASLRLDGWKLVTGPGREELYDLRRDPDELRDVAAEHPAVLEGLRVELARLRAGWPEQVRSGELELSDEERSDHVERLRALGYVE